MSKMSKLRKIDQSREAKEQFKSEALKFLTEVRTKEELKDLLGYESERAARNEISRCAMYYAILATSDRKGYRLAKKLENLEGEELLNEFNEVDHAIHEISSRIKCLKKRLKPLIAYKKVAEKKLTGRLIEMNEKAEE